MSVFDLPKKIEWSDPINLQSYRYCPKGPGLYAIGEPRDASQPVTPATGFDPYMGRWPDNFRGLYVGISLSNGEGIRGRLRSHARGRGSKNIRDDVKAGKDLHFLYMAGLAATNLEGVFVHMHQDEIFPYNRRVELRRQAQRFWVAGQAMDWANGREIVNFFDIPGYFEDG